MFQIWWRSVQNWAHNLRRSRRVDGHRDFILSNAVHALDSLDRQKLKGWGVAKKNIQLDFGGDLDDSSLFTIVIPIESQQETRMLSHALNRAMPLSRN